MCYFGSNRFSTKTLEFKGELGSRLTIRPLPATMSLLVSLRMPEIRHKLTRGLRIENLWTPDIVLSRLSTTHRIDAVEGPSLTAILAI